MCKRWQQPSSATIVAVFEEIMIFFFFLLMPMCIQTTSSEEFISRRKKNLVSPRALCGNCRCLALQRRRRAVCFWAPQPIERLSSHWDARRAGTLEAGSVPGGWKHKGAAFRGRTASTAQLYGSVQPDEGWVSAIKPKVAEEGWRWLWMTNPIA